MTDDSDKEGEGETEESVMKEEGKEETEGRSRKGTGKREKTDGELNIDPFSFASYEDYPTKTSPTVPPHSHSLPPPSLTSSQVLREEKVKKEKTEKGREAQLAAGLLIIGWLIDGYLMVI